MASSNYTIKNLREDVEDSAVAGGFSPQLEARFAREPLEAKESGLSYQRLAPGFRGFGHRHQRQEEIYVVVGGSGRAKIGDDLVDLRRWDAIRVAPDAKRGFEAGAEGLELLAYGAPYTGPGDAELDPGWWED
jgi:mannose-6-phosphate isomerase-like protein (cupin superfamily)